MNIIKFLSLYVKILINRCWIKLKLFFHVGRYSARRSTHHKITFPNLSSKPLIFLGMATIVFIAVVLFNKYYSNQIFCPTVSEGMVGIVSQNNLPQPVTFLLSEPLFVFDNQGLPVPRLVESWNVNNENTLYTIKLKNNLFWNDKTKVKSEDLVFNLHDVEISYPDENTIVFKLADSFSPFLTLLTNPVFKKNTLVGLGKYNIAKAEYNHANFTKLFLLPRDNLNCKESVKINIRFYPDEETLKTAFLLGEVDVLLNIQNKELYNNIPGVSFKENIDYQKLVLIYYNTKDKFLTDKNLRKALNSATPIIEGYKSAITSIFPGSWAYLDTVKDNRANKEVVDLYLNKLENKADLSLILTTTYQFNQLAEKIVTEWKKAGVNAVVRQESGIPQNFQILLTSVMIPHDPDQYVLWHSTQTLTNLAKYSAPRVDKDLEDARKIPEIERRKEKYADFQREIADDTPATFLFFPNNITVYRNKVKENLNKILPLQFTSL